MVEQGTENPRVPGSIPGPGTTSRPTSRGPVDWKVRWASLFFGVVGSPASAAAPSPSGPRDPADSRVAATNVLQPAGGDARSGKPAPGLEERVALALRVLERVGEERLLGGADDRDRPEAGLPLGPPQEHRRQPRAHVGAPGELGLAPAGGGRDDEGAQGSATASTAASATTAATAVRTSRSTSQPDDPGDTYGYESSEGRQPSKRPVKDRTQVENPKTGLWVKRNVETGRFTDVKTTGGRFKGVRREK